MAFPPAGQRLRVFRLLNTGLALILAIVEIGLGENLLSIPGYGSGAGLLFDHETLGIAVGGLTVLTVSPLLLVDYVRVSLYNKMALVLAELVWFALLGGFWFAEGQLIAYARLSNPGTVVPKKDVLDQIYSDTLAMEIIAFLVSSILFSHTVVLLVATIRQQVRRIWFPASSDQEHSTAIPLYSAHGSTVFAHSSLELEPLMEKPGPNIPGLAGIQGYPVKKQ
ncbi:hypothetical protein C8Q77DRAFT_1210115 [Trametes polyzona]|nr:hypothetical protein C8Q77DRAFT_1210115 [Trametes polyzona]